MKRRNFLISGAAGIAVGFIPGLGFSEKKEESLRKVQAYRDDEWKTISMRDMKKGDRFRMFDPSGKPVIGNDGSSVFVANEDARIMVYDGKETWGCNSEEMKQKCYERLVDGRWASCSLKDVKKGDRYRIFDNGEFYPAHAASEPWQMRDGVWGITNCSSSGCHC
jgi:hypothetical protein